MKTGLILEGGAMRGLFSAGVIDVMLEQDIAVDGMIGVSAGAAFGCNFKSKQAGRVLRYNKRFCKDKRFCSFYSLLKTGDLYGADFCYREIPETLDPFDKDTFANDPTEFYLVCTDIESGKAVYKQLKKSDGNAMDWFRASASMPLVSTPVEIGKQKLLDGGIVDSIPVRYFESIGYEHNIIVLTQPTGYQKKKNALLSLMRIALRKYPNVALAMVRRHEIYKETLAYIGQLEQQGKALVIRPPVKLEVGHVEHDAERLQQAYDMGRAEALRRINEIKNFIKSGQD